jgi:hypothetical protein
MRHLSIETGVSRRTFLCQIGCAVLAGTGSRLLAKGTPQFAPYHPSLLVPDWRKPLLTLDLHDATSPEAAELLFKFVSLNYCVDKEVYGFATGMAQNVGFDPALHMLLNAANPKLTYDKTAGIYHISLYRDSPLPPKPDPPLIQPSDLMAIPAYPTAETMPRRISGILLWADKPQGAILETGGPFTGDKRTIRKGDLVPSGVPEEPHLWVQKIERESVVLHRHKGKPFVVPLTDLTPFRR